MLNLPINIRSLLSARYLFILVMLSLGGCTATQNVSQQSNETLSAAENENYQLAISALKSGKSKSAEAILKELIKSKPNFANAYVNLGIISLGDDQLDQAESYLTQALSINPDNIVALNQLGIVQRHKGDFPRSKELYEKALSIDADYAYAHLNLGILYDLYFYDFQNALEHYKKYQDLTNESDKTVEKWIVDLERQMSKKVTAK